MSKRFKDLTVKLSNKLTIECYKFLQDNLEDEEETTDIINLVLSAHCSSLFTCMKQIASDHEEHTILVNKFIKNLTNYIRTLEPIENIERLDN